ncbi:MAG TPA: nuclear transport factor 2 family protein, partial [Candidatus Acidoferrum sp.]|nr:nuclear transport factor 2 family protein [Candidatus Acidoferrum sp.]
MKLLLNRWTHVIAGLLLCLSPLTRAQEMTPATLVDRQQVQDLITHYYYNFGRENPENFSDFYADDAELILGTKSYKGKDGIMQAYGRAPGSPPRKAPERYTFNVTISNPLITVHGNTATSELIFTEYVQEKQGDPTKMTTQGREYSTFV